MTGEFGQGSRWVPSDSSPPIPVKAGQVIGKVGVGSFDFSVHDAEVTLSGYVVPSRYDGEPWKVHTIDPFEPFVEPLRTQLMEHSLRTTEPRGGRIDYDIDGRLIGNWFLEGTVDYRGSGPLVFPNYWYGHFAIVYDYIDPTQIRIGVGGLGDDGGMVFGVRGNSPDPADVTPTSGLIKYEITSSRYSFPGSEIRGDNGETRGTLLVQMLGDRRIELEVFLGQAPDQVQGFTSAARIYLR